MKFDEEFKQAISQLPSKDKDKLILRLLKRDVNLANQLYFELISGDSVEGRRSNMEIRIKNEITKMTGSYYSPGYLLLDIRSLSAEITQHVKITRDKYGEVSLNILMLKELLIKNSTRIAEAKLKKSYTLGIYIIARVFKILILIKSLHEDYFLEFEDGLKELGQLISNNPMLIRLAIDNGLDVNWLLQAEIPEDIAAIHKDIRSKGFLK